MGSILQAECKCGFRCEIWAGSGMVNSDKKCYFPALCESCKELVIINYLVKYPRCPKCKKKVKFYKGLELQAKDVKKNQDIVFSWNLKDDSLIIFNTGYKCPKCNEFSLKFKLIGYFD